MQQEKLADFLREFASITDRDEQMDMLIELSEEFSPVPERIAKPPYPAEHLVPGCQSEVYVFADRQQDGTLKFFFAVENPQGISAKSMAVILDKTLSGATADEILNATPNIVYDIFGKGIAMGKGQGLMGMIFFVQALTRNELKTGRPF